MWLEGGKFSVDVAGRAVDNDAMSTVYWLWWEPPEIGDPDESAVGMWMIAVWHDPDEMPKYGDVLGAGPIDAAADWLAGRCGCSADALVRRDDFEVGVYARQSDGALDYDRVDRWITCRRYTISESAMCEEKRMI